MKNLLADPLIKRTRVFLAQGQTPLRLLNNSEKLWFIISGNLGYTF